MTHLVAIRRLRGSETVLLAVGLAAAIASVEYATGYDFHLTAVFLVPVCWVTWTVGRRAGAFLALTCTIAWLLADLLTGHPYRYPAIPYWNALMLMAFFVLIVFLLSGFQDIHKKLLKAQSQLRDQNERLEQTVQQRTAALMAEIAERQRLEKVTLQAERLAMVGTIAAQVAHEVRNPLGSITLNLDLLFKEIEKLAGPGAQSTEEGRTLVDEMREEIRRIQRVLEEYLRFARLRKPDRKPVQLDELLKQKLAFMDPVFKNAGIRLQTRLGAGLKTINADEEQVWQAILNLLQNSLEAMPGGGTLAISSGRENGEVLLRLADSGNGMTREQMDQLFVPFFTTKPRGTGLGLPLTQRILNEHGAQIECVSEVGKGSTFTIHFPAGGRS